SEAGRRSPRRGARAGGGGAAAYSRRAQRGRGAHHGGQGRQALPRPTGGEPGPLDGLRGAPAPRGRRGLPRSGGAPGTHGVAQAHARRRAQPGGGRSGVPRQGRRPPAGRRTVSEVKALAGRVAVVTGGGRGIGLAIARSLAEDGASVVVSGRDAGRLDAAAVEIDGAGAAALGGVAAVSRR